MNEPSTPNDPINETIDESFPASDPPQATTLHAGPPAGDQPPPPIAHLKTVRSTVSVGEAAARVERAVTAAGMKVFARIDQAAEARAAGLTMRPAVLVLFGDPKGGTPLMIARPAVAIDLPLKALIFEDGCGQAWLSYNTPSLLVARHGADPGHAAKLAPAGELLERAIRD